MKANAVAHPASARAGPASRAWPRPDPYHAHAGCRRRSTPPSGCPGGNWLQLIRGYIGDGAVILGLAIATVGLLWMAYTGVAKFNECRVGKAEWSELGVLGIVGAVVLLFMMFLLNQAATVIV
jgi:integrating conjugative element membrane protein (TIGR03745 family)